MPPTRRSQRLLKQKENSQGAQRKKVDPKEIEIINQPYAVHHQTHYTHLTIEEYCEMFGITKPQYKLNIKPRKLDHNTTATRLLQRRMFAKRRNENADLKMTEYLIYSKYLTMFAFFLGGVTLLLQYIVFPILTPSISLLFQSTILATKIRLVLNATNFIISSTCSFYLTEKIQATDGNAIFQKAYNDRIRAQRAKQNNLSNDLDLINHQFFPGYTVYEKACGKLNQPLTDEQPVEILDRKKRIY